MGGPQRPPGRYGEPEQSLDPAAEDSPAIGLVTTPTELSKLRFSPDDGG